tara:strand:+ start:537 stop:878 length:342 start_codon:yes stop_codon:yes gene_type:complete
MPDLKEPPPVKHLYRKDAVDTSVQAALDLNTDHVVLWSKDIRLTRLEYVVLVCIRKLGPCISDEVREQFPNWSYSTVTARYRSLLDKGLIKDTGKRRKGNSGRKQRVMEATAK